MKTTNDLKEAEPKIDETQKESMNEKDRQIISYDSFDDMGLNMKLLRGIYVWF